MKKARLFASDNIIQLSAEMLEWHKKGIRQNGKFDELICIVCSELYQDTSDVLDAYGIAESIIRVAAFEFIARKED